MIHLFKDTFNIARKGLSPDGQGGWSETYSVISAVSGRLSKRSAPMDTYNADMRRSQPDFVFYCPGGTDIQREDKIINGTTSYRIINVLNPSLNSHHLECLCQQTQEGL